MIIEDRYRIIILIILLAAILRFWGIWHDYPYSFYPDESHFVKRALSFGSLDLNPHWFHKPALYMYILFFEYSLLFLIGKIIGLWVSVSDFAVFYIKNAGPFYLIGRFTTILFSLGSIWVVYRIGETHFRKGAGVVSALLLSLSYGHVASSQYVKADTPALFFTILAAFFLLNYFRDKKTSALILAGIFTGMGTATKYYAIPMLFPIIAGVVLVHGHAENNVASHQMVKTAYRIGIILAVFVITYFVCSPYNFIDPLGRKSTFSPIFAAIRIIAPIFGGEKVVYHSDFIRQGTIYFQATIDYLWQLVTTPGMGPTIAVIGILGFGYLLSQRNKKILLFVLYPILFMIVSVFVAPGYAEPRHQLPIYPFLAISGGAFIAEIAKNKYLHSHITYVALILCLVFPFYKIVERDLHISKQDTRNIAKAWIESNIPPGTKILINENGPQLLRSEENIQKILEKAEKADPKGQFTAHYNTFLRYQLLAAKDSLTYDIAEIRIPWWRESEIKEGIHELTSDRDRDMGNPLKLVGVERYDYYVKNGFEYAIVHSYKYAHFLKDSEASRNFPSFARFYRELFSKGKLIKEFSQDEGEKRPGPEVKIFRFGP